MSRERNIEIVTDTLSQCENDLSWMVEEAYNVIYNEPCEEVESNLGKAPIRMLKTTTIQALIDNSEKEYAILNFASATHPGGGALKGASAQEESIVRVSTLYPSLLKCKEFYGRGKAPYYTDNVIYSENIYVIKNDFGDEIDHIKCNVITCAAPNYRNDAVDIRRHIELLTKRFTKIIKIAIINGNSNLILGAWGCGVFSNPPQINAEIFRKVLNKFDYFDDIIFAIPDSDNYDTFKDILKR